MARPRQVSDEQILEAARDCFLEHGPSVSLERIAQRLGISGPALLKRAGSKHELLLAALALEKPAFATPLEAGPDAARPIPEQLAELVLAMVTFLREAVPRLLVLRVGGVPVERLPGVGRRAAPVRHALAAWLRRAAEADRVETRDPDAVADLLAGAVEARCLMAYVFDEPRSEGDAAWARGLVDALWDGIAPAGSGSADQRKGISRRKR